MRHWGGYIYGSECSRYRRNEKRGLTFNAQQAKATEVPSLADNVDFIVSTTPISASVTKLVIKGLPFLTGIGKDKAFDDIEAELRK